MGLLIIGIGKFIVFTATLAVGVASALLGFAFMFSFPPLGMLCITPLIFIIFGKKDFLKKFM